MTSIQTVSTILAFSVVLAHILIVAGVLYFFFFRKKYPKILENLSKNSLLYSLIVSLVATCGSLYFSKVAGYTPCELCWYQRILMYPEVILLGIAMYKKDKSFYVYPLPIAVIGWFVSAYHTFGSLYQTFGSALFKLPETCGATGGSCLTFRALAFGYVSIPVMSLTAFTLLIILLLIGKRYNKQQIN